MLTRASRSLPRPPGSGPLLLAGMVVSSLSAIFLVSCVDLWDAYQASRSGGGGAPNATDAGAWAALDGSLAVPHTVLPAALRVPAWLGGGGGGT